MKRFLRQFLALAALIAIAAATGMLIRENIKPLPPVAEFQPQQTAERGQDIETQPVAQFDPPPFSQFAETLRRPLFRQSRRPLEIESPPPESAADRSLRATLQGVLISSTEKVALVTTPDSSNVIRIAEGEELQGWRVDKITYYSVSFSHDGSTATIRLEYKRGLPPQF